MTAKQLERAHSAQFLSCGWEKVCDGLCPLVLLMLHAMFAPGSETDRPSSKIDTREAQKSQRPLGSLNKLLKQRVLHALHPSVLEVNQTLHTFTTESR